MQTILDEILTKSPVIPKKRHNKSCGCSACKQKNRETAYHPFLGYGKSISAEEEFETNTVSYHPSLGPGIPISRETEYEDDEFELVGKDGRKRIYSTKKVPFRWTCMLYLDFPDPDKKGGVIRFRGSGVLVANRHILTCGHNLYGRYTGSKGTSTTRYVRRVYAYPGRSGSSKPFGFTTAKKIKVHAKWKKNKNPRYDLGMIRLRKSLGTTSYKSLNGEKLGYWGSKTNGFKTRIIPFKNSELQNKMVNVAGYPIDKPLELWWDADRISHAKPKAGNQLIYYKTDTCAGNSGGPVWLYNSRKGGRFLIAIHTGTCLPGYSDCKDLSGKPCYKGRQRRSSNRGVLLSKSVINMIRRWIRTL